MDHIHKLVTHMYLYQFLLHDTMCKQTWSVVFAVFRCLSLCHVGVSYPFHMAEDVIKLLF